MPFVCRYNLGMPNLKQYFLLDDDVIFLNHGSFGACPRPVFQVYQSWQARLERQPVLFMGREYSDLLREARTALAGYLHTLPGNLVYIPNATFGVNIIARSLSFQPGDEVLTTNHEYGACDNTWEFIARKTGVVIKRQSVPLPVSDAQHIVAQIWQGVTPRTKLIYLSHISSPTGLRLPVEALCNMARLAGIMTLIDGAHAPGQISLNLDTLGADFYTGNCHKWMLAPKGAAFLYVRPEMQALVEPLVVSWGYHTSPELSSGSSLVDLLEWTGTHDPSAALAVPAAIQFMQEHHWEEQSRRCHQLLAEALPRISQVTGMPPLYPADSHLFAQMAAVELPGGHDPLAIKTRLYEQFHIEAPIIAWQGRNLLRISVQAYNTPADLDALVNALGELL
jgi:isopenicillin-N epimerase